MEHNSVFVDCLIIGCLIVLMASASSLLGLNFYIVCLTLLVLLSIRRKVKVGRELLWVVFFWLGINLIAFYFTRTNQTLNAILGPLLLITIPYFALKLIGENFWTLFEKLIFFLVIIDLVLYIFSNLDPSLFTSLYPYFRPWTNDVFYKYSGGEGEYWYSYIFTFNARFPYRNSGFMWEPGAYGLVLILILLYRWSINGKIIGKHEFVYIVSIITTLSTASFLALFVLFFGYMLSVRNSFFRIILILVFIFACFWVYNLPFMGDKLSDFVSQAQVYDYGSSEEGELQANRVLSLFIAIKQIRHLPTGYGCTPNATFTPEFASISLVNGIGDLLLKWGVIGFLIIIYLIYSFWRMSYRSRYAILATVSYIIVLFSNPISNNPVLWIVIWSSLICGVKSPKVSEEKSQRIEDTKIPMSNH